LNLWHRFRESVSKAGLANTLLDPFIRVVARLSGGRVRIYKYYFVAQPVATRATLAPHRGKNFALRWLDAWPGQSFGPRPPGVTRERFDAGSTCLLATQGADFAGTLWLHVGPFADDEVRCRYEPLPADRSVWDFDVYVEPALRFGFLLPKMWDEANAFLRGRGATHTFSRISAFNVASLAAHARLGAERVGSAVIVQTGRWQLLLTDLAPRIHLSWRDDQVPTLRLRARGAAPMTN
jgi:hypothetical protein